jgi:hypothetical protein
VLAAINNRKHLAKLAIIILVPCSLALSNAIVRRAFKDLQDKDRGRQAEKGAIAHVIAYCKPIFIL